MVEQPLLGVAEPVFVGDVARGASDFDVLAMARAQRRILITEDYDFGALIFGDKHEAPPGLIHLVLEGMSKDQRAAKFAAEIERLLQLAPGQFVVFSKHAPRSRPLP